MLSIQFLPTFIYENISKTKKLMFTKEIVAENISFRYSSDTSNILDKINLKIKKEKSWNNRRNWLWCTY